MVQLACTDKQVVGNLYVRQANLKAILEVTGSHCSSRLGRLRKQLSFVHILIFLYDVEVWMTETSVNTCVDKGSSYCLKHVVSECLADVVECMQCMKICKH